MCIVEISILVSTDRQVLENILICAALFFIFIEIPSHPW